MILHRILHSILPTLLLLLPILTACAGNTSSTQAPIQAASMLQSVRQPMPFPEVGSSSVKAAQIITTTPYLDQIDISLDDVKYLPLVESEMPLNSAERDLLTQNGFVVSDRYNWDRFVEAYAWIYWKDLPVLITTDSILHAFHQSYVDLLIDLEMSTMKPQLAAMLETTRTTLAEQQLANTDAALEPLYIDVDTYLAVAQHLLQQQESTEPDVQEYVALATDATAYAEVDLFGEAREIDFTLFKPRAHYAYIPEWPDPVERDLRGYFRAMSWLGQVDFRFVSYNPLTNEPEIDPPQIVAAAILRDAVDETDQRMSLNVVNGILELLIGRSDNTTLTDFDRFLVDAELNTPAEILAADEAGMLELFTTNDYGQQRITGQLLQRHTGNNSDQPVPRPTSFLLLGQRFALDSFVLSELVYDRLMVDDEPIYRALPSPLDVMAALGNPRAETHLESELAGYQYGPYLDNLQQTITDLPADYWRAPVYNQWLGLFRTLNAPSTDDNFPLAMRTSAWADKMLQTQLGSWTQLRHDNILYVKQSFTQEQVSCEYPAGYVEPYPAFYAAMALLAEDVGQVLASMPLPANGNNSETRSQIIIYLNNLADVSSQLEILAEKELRLEEFTPDEEIFIKSMIKREVHSRHAGCTMVTEVLWDGWYASLFYNRDDDPALIADVHTNPTRDPKSALYPPRVLHAATGPASAQFLTVDTDEGTTLYVGPAYSYFEVVTVGDESTPPERYNDDEWRAILADGPYPSAPNWTESFRLPIEDEANALQLPSDAEIRFRPIGVDPGASFVNPADFPSVFLPLIR